MSEDVWTTPASNPATPGGHSTEGYLEFPGYTSTPVYAASGYALREALRILGCDFYDGPDKTEWADAESVEGGRLNDTRRVAYRALARLWALNFLAGNWPYAWVSGFLYNAEEAIGNNFCNVHEFSAGGSGTQITIQWLTGGTDARQLTGEASYFPVHPGMCAMVDRSGNEGIAIVTEVEFQAYGASHSAVLTLHRPLNANTLLKCWIVAEEKLDVMPAFRLRVANADATTPVQCEHAVYTFHSAYSSLKAHYPSLPCCAGIDGQWFCGRMDRATVDLSLFVAHGGRCHNSSCPYYEALRPWYPDDDQTLTNFWIGRGRYARETVAGGMVEAEPWNYVKIGKDYFTGLLALLGYPAGGYFAQFGGYSNLPLTGMAFIARKDYSGIGDVMFRTGATLANGFDEYLSWYESVLAEAAPTDNVGLVLDLAPVTKRDPAGGAGYGSRVLSSDRPGAHFETAVGVRRIGHVGYAEASDTAGVGTAGVQRARPRRYTSAEFAVPYVHSGGALSDLDGETRLDFYSSAQSLTGGGSYNLLWRLPRFGETQRNPRERLAKGVTGTVAAASVVSASVLRLDFAVGATQVVYGGSKAGPVAPTYQDCHCGGNIVMPEICKDLINPASGRAMGDRQRGLYPGDTIEFDTAELAGITITCLRAEAYGGSTDAGATQPNGGAPGVTDWITNNYDKRDRAWFSLEGEHGAIVKAFAAGGGFDGGDVAVERIAYSAICPPGIDYAETSTGYAPSVVRVTDGVSKTALVAGTDYWFDPVAGAIYVDTSGWTPGQNYNLFFGGYVFDQRTTYVCEDAEACLDGLEAVVDGAAYLDAGGIFDQSGFALCKRRLSDNKIVSLGATFHAPNFDPVVGAWYANPTGTSYPTSYTDVTDVVSELDITTHAEEYRKYNWYAEDYGHSGLIGDALNEVNSGGASKDGWDQAAGGGGDAIRVQYQHRGFMWKVRPPKRWAKDQIGSARVNVTIGGNDQADHGCNVAITECAYTYTGDGATGWEAGTEQTDASATDLCLGLYRVTYDVTDTNKITALEFLANSELTSFPKITVDGYTTMNATVDITALLRTVYDYYWGLGANQELAVILKGDDGVSASGEVQDLLEGWISAFSGAWDPDMTGYFRYNSDEPYTTGGFSSVRKDCKQISFGGVSISSLRINPAAAGLDGIDYPFDADGHSHGPNVMAGA